MRIPSGVTDQVIYFVAVDSSDFYTRETGFSSFTVYRDRNGGGATAYTSPTITEIDSTNMPGVYKLLLDEDMTVAAANDSEEMILHITHAGMAPVSRVIELYLRWGDTLLTGATYNLATSAGRRLRHVEDVEILAEGTATAGDASSITLAAGSSTIDDFHNNAKIVIAQGTGAGQARHIHDYDGGDLKAFIYPAWVTNPSSDSVYYVYAEAMIHVKHIEDDGIDADAITAGAVTKINAALAATLATILTDTNELQTDWKNGGRLDSIIDAASTHSAADVWTVGSRALSTPGDYKATGFSTHSAADVNTALTSSHGSGSWASEAGGAGDTVVNEDTGGTDNLRYTTSGGAPIDNALIRAYLKTDYDNGNFGDAYIKGRATTGADGRWANNMMLDTGYTYTIYFYKQDAYGPDTEEVDV